MTSSAAQIGFFAGMGIVGIIALILTHRAAWLCGYDRGFHEGRDGRRS